MATTVGLIKGATEAILGIGEVKGDKGKCEENEIVKTISGVS